MHTFRAAELASQVSPCFSLPSDPISSFKCLLTNLSNVTSQTFTNQRDIEAKDTVSINTHIVFANENGEDFCKEVCFSNTYLQVFLFNLIDFNFSQKT